MNPVLIRSTIKKVLRGDFERPSPIEDFNTLKGMKGQGRD